MSREPYALLVRAVMHGRGGYDAPQLVSALEDAGATSVRTHLTTGNVTLVTGDIGRVVEVAETVVQGLTGDVHEVYARSLDELETLLAGHPFAAVPDGFDPFRTEVTFARDPLPSLELPIISPRGDVVVFAATERELLSASRDVHGVSSSAGGRLERLTGRRLTSRARSTVERLLAALRDLADGASGGTDAGN